MKRTLITLALVAIVQGAHAEIVGAGIPLQDVNAAGQPATYGSGQQLVQGDRFAGTGKAQKVKHAAGKDLKHHAGHKVHKNTGITGGVDMSKIHQR